MKSKINSTTAYVKVNRTSMDSSRPWLATVVVRRRNGMDDYGWDRASGSTAAEAIAAVRSMLGGKYATFDVVTDTL